LPCLALPAHSFPPRKEEQEEEKKTRKEEEEQEKKKRRKTVKSQCSQVKSTQVRV